MNYDPDTGVLTMLVDLPTKIKGFSKPNDDMTYTIVINSRLSSEQQRKTYDHEMAHILHNDFYCAESSDNIEYKRHLK